VALAGELGLSLRRARRVARRVASRAPRPAGVGLAEAEHRDEPARHRGGDARATHAALSSMARSPQVGLMTHFADADRPGGAAAQLERFERATAGLNGERSLANSSALFDLPDAHRNWVRPGIALYGATPFADRGAASLGLRAAMTMRSEIIGVQMLQRGDTVGYGSTFTTPAPMRIGIVACGYADGYPRHAPSGTPIDVAGMRTRTVGRPSMDLLAVDLEPVPDAGIGSPVELWGERVPVDEVAASAGTIGYELLCAVAPRVPMHVVD
jgi:alanine racemase